MEMTEEGKKYPGHLVAILGCDHAPRGFATRTIEKGPIAAQDIRF